MAATSEQRRAAVVRFHGPRSPSCIECGADLRAIRGPAVRCKGCASTRVGRPPVSHDQLLRTVRYEPETGHFFWLVDLSRVARAGQRAGGPEQRRDRAGLSRGGCYWKLIIQGKAYGAHRLAFFYVNGVWPKHEIDHINGDPGDNRIANLRDVPRVLNAQNRYLARRDSTTGLQGIERRRDRWLVSIGVNGKKRYLGSFGSPEEAVRFRDQAKAELHPGSPHYRLGAVKDFSEIGAGRLAGVNTCEGAPASACLAAIPQGGFNRDSSAGCRSSDTRARRPRREVTGGQQLPPPKVAAPDDRPLGQTAGAAPEKSEG